MYLLKLLYLKLGLADYLNSDIDLIFLTLSQAFMLELGFVHLTVSPLANKFKPLVIQDPAGLLKCGPTYDHLVQPSLARSFFQGSQESVSGDPILDKEHALV